MGADEATIIDDPYDGAADGRVAVRVLEAALASSHPSTSSSAASPATTATPTRPGRGSPSAWTLPLVSFASQIALEAGHARG